MDWGELTRGVGDWTASIADSTLVAGLIGAGAALLGGAVTNRRAAQQCLEDQKREDRAAWREQRHVAYAQVLSDMDALWDQLNTLHLCRYRTDGSTQLRDDYRSLRKDADDDLRRLREKVAGMRLIAAKPMSDRLRRFWSAVASVLNALPKEWSQETVDSSSEREMDELLAHAHVARSDVYKLMLDQLGLTED